MFKKIISFLFGQITWNAPHWFIFLQNKASAKPAQTIRVTLFAILLCLISFASYQWYQSQPKPEEIVAQIKPPKITPAEKVLIPDELTIDFGIITHGELRNKSVAKLNAIGTEVKSGITLTPAIEGKWWWRSDSQLAFVPSEDWPAGQTYRVEFDKNIFSKNSKISQYHETFSTLPFEIVINGFRFYQDPSNPSLRQAVATIQFSYPVDTASVENKISLVQQGSGQRYKYTLTYDQNKRAAYLHSEQITLTNTTRYLDLTLASGIKAMSGPSKTTQETTASLLIPDIASYFKVLDTKANIVRDPNDHPEQVLSIETSLGIADSELSKKLHVYLLPTDYPATSLKKAEVNYNWQTPGEVTEAVLAMSKPLPLKAIPSDRDYATLHSFRFHLVAPGYLYIKIDKGAKAFGDLALANDYVAVVRAPDYPKEITFLHKGSLLALGTEEKLSVLVRGLGAVKFDYARILPRDINHLITQTGGDFGNPYFTNYNFNQTNISEIFSQIQKFDATDPAKAQYSALDIGQYMAKGNQSGSRGLFLLQAQGWNTEQSYALDVVANRLVLITDLSMLAKDNSDGTHDVYVQSLTSGAPVANVDVAILGKNGVALMTLKTSAEGHALFPSLNDFINEKEPTVYIATHGNDVSFMPYNRSDRLLNYSRFDIGGVYSSSDNQASLTAFIFSDRGIYRPGDTAHVGMIIKKPYALPQLAGLPLEVIVTDSRGVTVKDEKMTLNPEGFFTFDYATSAVSPTGQYSVNLYIVKDNHPSSQIGSATFNVAEFLPDRMRISASLSPTPAKGWVSPIGLTADVGLWNLYGAPATNRRIAGKIVLSPHAVKFDAYPDYTFTDPLLDPKSPPKVFNDTLTETRTDDQGQAELDLKLDRFEKATYELTVLAEGFEAEGGRSVTTQTKTLVSPLSYLVGYKADGDLQFIKQHAVRNVRLIAINPNLQAQALSKLKVALIQQQPVTTLVKKDDGTYQYQSLMQSHVISQNPFEIAAEGANYTLPTDNIGDYLINITDESGAILSQFKFNVVGDSQQPIPKNAELNAKLNKTHFAPGEEIEIQVTAPYTGGGLITIERDKVYASQWFKASTTSSIQKIRLPADFQGNGYVNIAFVRDLNSAEIFMNPLSYSVLPFDVSHEAREMKVALNIPATAKPGDAFNIQYKTDKPGKIIVFAVDEGILQVTKFTTPDPLAFFFQKRALEVNTMQIVDQILPKFIAERELSAVGGDAGMAALYKNLNPFKRKTDAPVVYWSGMLDTDGTAKTLTYQIPDYFNGSLRVMAIAVAADAVGSATQTTEVRGDFVINPNTPTFAAPGDVFDVTSSIANNIKESGEHAKINVQLKTSTSLNIIDAASQTIEVGEGKEAAVHFKVKATDSLGNADLTFVATLGDKTSSRTVTLSIRPAQAYATAINSGNTTDASLKLKVIRSLYPEYRKVNAIASSSPLILLVGLEHYLNEYPYGCTEQLVSKAMPMLALAKQPWLSADAPRMNDKIQQTIEALSLRQMSNGAFNYWPTSGSAYNNDFATLYALHFLTDAKEQGYVNSNDMLINGMTYLKELVTQDVSTLEQARFQAYGIYLLTRNEIVTTNDLTHLLIALDKHKNLAWKNDITSAYIAATYKLLKSDAEAEKIIRYFKPQTTGTAYADDFYNNEIANSQYLYLLTRHFPDHVSTLDNSLLMHMVDAMNDDNISTVFAGYSSMALAAYTPYFSASNNAAISIKTIDTMQQQSTLSTGTAMYQQASIPLKTTDVVYDNPGKERFFYQLTQAGFNKDLPKQVVAQGIEVSREYLNADGHAITKINVGDEITVHIRLRTTKNDYINNIAVIDLLPGGFEIIRDSVNSEGSEYVDIREDRIIFFGGAAQEMKELIYRVKATTSGEFVLPPVFATSMYNAAIKASGLAQKIIVH